MNDTVTRLMALADEYANTKQAAAWSEKGPLQLKPEEIRKMWTDAFDIRQALQDELTKLLGDSKANSILFTPLSNEHNTRKGDWLDTTRPKYLNN